MLEMMNYLYMNAMLDNNVAMVTMLIVLAEIHQSHEPLVALNIQISDFSNLL